MATTVFLDFESRSRGNLPQIGQDEYWLHGSTVPLCLAYSIDGAEPELWLPGSPCPPALKAAALDEDCEFHAHNAPFEMAAWRHYFVRKLGWPAIPINRWHCTAALAAYNGVPRALAKGAQALKLAVQKDDEGRRIMLQMCKPKKVTKKDPREWYDDEEKHIKLRAYCQQDVRVEQQIHAKLRQMRAVERQVWMLDQEINQRGILVDRESIDAAIFLGSVAAERLNQRLYKLTGGDVPRLSLVSRLQGWLSRQGVQMPSLAAQHVQETLSQDKLPEECREALQIRLSGAKSSIAKYVALEARSRADNRVRGAFIYYGAHTGRWSGSGVQFQNIPRGKVVRSDGVNEAAEYMRSRDFDLIECLYGDVPQFLSDMIRPMIIAPRGKKLIVCDFAGIEARVLAAIAGEDDLVRAFKQGRDIYKDMASRIYGVPVLEVTKDQRQIGKIACLGLGYGMGAPKFAATCARFGVTIDEDFAARVVDVYRSTNNAISRYWKKSEAAARNIVTGAPNRKITIGQIDWARIGDDVVCVLPSGRPIFYRNMRLEEKMQSWGEMGESLVFDAPRGTTDTYGGSITENIVQAAARDFLAEALLRLAQRGFTIVGHVHDEVILEASPSQTVKEVEEIMCELPDWARGYPIAAEGFEGERYRK